MSLPWRPEHRGDRGKEYKEVQRRLPCQGVQVPGPLNLRRHDRGEALLIQVDQKAIVEDSGRMDDPAQRWHRAADHSENAGYLLFLRYIHLGYNDPGTDPLHLLYCCACLAVSISA